MQTRNRMLDDLAKVATSALGVAGGLKDEVEGRLRQQFERILADMDLVTREEFEVVQAMAAKARDEQEALAERLAALEKELAAAKKTRMVKSAGTAKPASTAKTARAKRTSSAKKP
jgi:BMFP domain-containing protein YqiC